MALFTNLVDLVDEEIRRRHDSVDRPDAARLLDDIAQTTTRYLGDLRTAVSGIDDGLDAPGSAHEALARIAFLYGGLCREFAASAHRYDATKNEADYRAANEISALVLRSGTEQALPSLTYLNGIYFKDANLSGYLEQTASFLRLAQTVLSPDDPPSTLSS